ncbi:reverse transcriptase-like protein [Novosphingobium olei]|uniref:Reverse transcriptase-like protein n=1 Tax=Novosphingobium olei TaxID=2728851 RepID=A0A7Y0BLQ5_9SPHN|nr:reverse transcriptase-like protein [Novosphingobium olei]NML92655.1 reverse transcriptase-like protein [Novosphingobium olei]
MAKAARVKVFFDGGCRPNPGTMECAVVIGGEAFVRDDLGHGGSHEAEWRAAIEALRLARERDLSDFVLLGDALAVIAVIEGRTRARPEAAPLLAAFQALAGGEKVRVRYVPRGQNLAGVALAKRHPR